jgi:hypothetical protein
MAAISIDMQNNIEWPSLDAATIRRCLTTALGVLRPDVVVPLAPLVIQCRNDQAVIDEWIQAL